MICSEKPLTQASSISPKQLNSPQKQELVAHWTRVNGQLICQWVTV